MSAASFAAEKAMERLQENRMKKQRRIHPMRKCRWCGWGYARHGSLTDQCMLSPRVGHPGGGNFQPETPASKKKRQRANRKKIAQERRDAEQRKVVLSASDARLLRKAAQFMLLHDIGRDRSRLEELVNRVLVSRK